MSDMGWSDSEDGSDNEKETGVEEHHEEELDQESTMGDIPTIDDDENMEEVDEEKNVPTPKKVKESTPSKPVLPSSSNKAPESGTKKNSMSASTMTNGSIKKFTTTSKSSTSGGASISSVLSQKKITEGAASKQQSRPPPKVAPKPPKEADDDEETEEQVSKSVPINTNNNDNTDLYLIRHNTIYAIDEENVCRNYGHTVPLPDADAFTKLSNPKNWPHPEKIMPTSIVVIKGKFTHEDTPEKVKMQYLWGIRFALSSDPNGTDSRIIRIIPKQNIAALLKTYARIPQYRNSSLLTKYKPYQNNAKTFPPKINNWHKTSLKSCVNTIGKGGGTTEGTADIGDESDDDDAHVMDYPVETPTKMKDVDEIEEEEEEDVVVATVVSGKHTREEKDNDVVSSSKKQKTVANVATAAATTTTTTTTTTAHRAQSSSTASDNVIKMNVRKVEGSDNMMVVSVEGINQNNVSPVWFKDNSLVFTVFQK